MGIKAIDGIVLMWFKSHINPVTQNGELRMEHALTISLEDFDNVYTDVDWYGHDEEEIESHEDHEDED